MISGQFVVLGIALVAVALTVASFVSLRTEMLSMQAERQRAISQIEAKWLPLLSRAVWTRSDTDIELITLAIVQPEEIDALALEIHGGETVNLGDAPEHHRDDTVWPILYEHGDETIEVGRLTVSAHSPAFGEVAAQILAHALPADLIKILATLVPFFFLVHFGVMRRLSRLTTAVSAMSRNLPDHDLANLTFAPRKIFSAEDELDELVRAFNALLAGIRDQRQMRADREVELKRSLEHSQFLIREVHHRVKNNLQMLISLFSLHAGRLGESERAVMLEA
ncbi:MAG: histidine kinase dimerization/phosphoacceptor domain -containing protein, partial [Spirochaetota bacterium]